MIDPIVEEMRHNFEELAERFDFDVDRIAQYLKEQQSKHPDRLARPSDLSLRDSESRGEMIPHIAE